jgi:4-amino-4-deoxy-L-arabinose transferase-like glycosyltransferase
MSWKIKNMESGDETMIEIPSPQQAIEIQKIMRKRTIIDMPLSCWSLPLILTFQALFSWILLQNTSFQDEALYIYAGRQIWSYWLGGPPLIDHYSFYFSGYPYFYPVIAGVCDSIGGLEFVRAFSLTCMLIVTTCGYSVTKKLFQQKSAVFAALFFVCQGPVLFLCRLATYDALCLCLLALGMMLAVNAGYARRPWMTLSIGPLLVLAFAAKYAALLFIPAILVLLALCTLQRWGWISMLVRVALGLLSLLLAGGVIGTVMLHLDPTVLQGLATTTTNRAVLMISSRWMLIGHVIQMGGFSYSVGLAGLLFMRKKERLIIPLFLALALLAPVYHIYKAEQVSLDKHLAFSMLFLMPVAGYTLASLSGFFLVHSPGRYWLSGMMICLALFQSGVSEAQNMYAQWPSTTLLSYVLNTQVRRSNGRYLAEQFEVSRYNLQNDTDDWQWTGLDFFHYTDMQGHQVSGNQAYIQAVRDGYFNLIQLNYAYNHPNAHIIAQAIVQSKKYTLIAKIPYRDLYDIGNFWVWRKS